MNELHKFTDNRKKILNCPRSNKPPELKFISITILKMILTGALKIIVVEKKSYSILNLVVHYNDFSEKYLQRQRWKVIVLISPSQHNSNLK